MNPLVKYTIGRTAFFAICVIPAALLMPDDTNPFLTLLIALTVSAVASLFLLRGWREEAAEHLAANKRRRSAEKERLRRALAGEDDAPPVV
jgi:hypothetical protein